MKRLFAVVMLMLTSSWAQATVSLGEVAQNAMVPADMMVSMLVDIAYILGVALFLSGIAQYNEHRNNPNGVPLSRAIVFMVLGVIVFCIPWIARLSSAYG